MSHLVRKECSMTDLETILAVAKALGWEVRENERVTYFAGHGAVCDYTLELKGEVSDYAHSLEGTYSIGIQVSRENGAISLLHDNAMNGRDVFAETSGKVDPCTERIINKLKQGYEVERVKRFGIVHRKRVREQKLEGGRVALWVQGR